ncbi:MAG: dipeptidase [Bryobacteraceae bacterium]
MKFSSFLTKPWSSAVLSGLAILVPIAASGQAQVPRISDEAVRRAHAAAILIDTHNDVTSETIDGLDIGPRRSKGHTDLPRLKAGGVGAVFFAAYVSGTYAPKGQSAHRALAMIDTIRHDIVDRYPGQFRLALTAGDIEAARREGKIAALIGIEGGHAIENDVRLLRTFFELGVRYMTLTHANHNGWADSSGATGAPNHGLSATLGRRVIAEMNRLGMMVDISHVSDKTFEDTLAVSRAPVFASHSSCRALSNIKRNMSDEMIRALAKKGGVIQINFGCEFLSQVSADSSSWSNPALKGKKNVVTKRASLADAVAHIRHVATIAGVDAVGIGSDFDGVPCTPVGLDDVSRFPALTRALLENGFSAADVKKIYGGNLLRVMRAVQAAATPDSPVQ